MVGDGYKTDVHRMTNKRVKWCKTTPRLLCVNTSQRLQCKFLHIIKNPAGIATALCLNSKYTVLYRYIYRVYDRF